MQIIRLIKIAVRNEVIRFLATGALNTFVGFCIYSISFFLIGREGVALTINYVLGGLFNYFSYSFLVFKSYETKRFVLFCIAYIITFSVNLGIIHYLIRHANVNPYISQLAALTVCPLLLYILLRKFVFLNNTGYSG
jgi:putative flippase GtrA